MALVGFICLPKSPAIAPTTGKQESITQSKPTPPKQMAPDNPSIVEQRPRKKPLVRADSTVPNKSAKPTEPKASVSVLLKAEFINPSSLSIGLYNPSEDVVENVSWAMAAFRASDLCFFSFPTQAIGYIKPESRNANYAMPLSTMQKYNEGCDGVLRSGDELTGSVSIDCPRCSIHAYIIHLVWEQSGWYFEYPEKAGYVMLKDMSNKGNDILDSATNLLYS
jgi:hypothetical protein